MKDLTNSHKLKIKKACESIIRVIIDSDESEVISEMKIHFRKEMLDFANYCIGEGFTSNATEADLKKYFENAK
ncbi:MULTISPECIES: hypothetical protein [unclassified Arcicella]|uniref:hypothetical protein n=1 Tax=unclassified Arcicella TaxID=2644986 RepID=UPI002859C536|nr:MULTISPECIES: hypothetical protein [unclassified Arcicella]MDR6564938.1 hypothetical protein [Arcicella sp. BE51]MDR6814728.1 hypothetical protein [Arcicella sp. BE140]MDR6826174.1 hypothetical protein [Arcicella sp. BE139]